MYKEVKGKKMRKKKEKRGASNTTHTPTLGNSKARDQRSISSGWLDSSSQSLQSSRRPPPIFFLRPPFHRLFSFFTVPDGLNIFIRHKAQHKLQRKPLERLLCCRTEDNRRGGYVLQYVYIYKRYIQKYLLRQRKNARIRKKITLNRYTRYYSFY